MHRYNYYIVNIGEKNNPAYQAIIPKFPRTLIFADSIKEMEDIVPDTIKDYVEQIRQEGRNIPRSDKEKLNEAKTVIQVDSAVYERSEFEAIGRCIVLK